jgi:transcriptional regulator with XRE-family HTH domain
VPRPRALARKSISPQAAFGTVLKRLRQEAGRSQDSFAHQTGYHRNYIGQLERGEKSPSSSALFNLAAAFNVKPSEMISLVEHEFKLSK